MNEDWFTVFGEDIVVMSTEPDDEDFIIEFNGRSVRLEDILEEVLS